MAQSFDNLFASPSYRPSSPTLFDAFDTQNVFSDSQLNRMYNDVLANQQKIWDREDSAYQRMVKDMQKAGLNPWTGISSGGSQTSSNNGAVDALSSLFNGLNYNLGIMNLSDKQNARFVDTYMDVMNMLVKVATSGISAFGSW